MRDGRRFFLELEMFSNNMHEGVYADEYMQVMSCSFGVSRIYKWNSNDAR